MYSVFKYGDQHYPYEPNQTLTMPKLIRAESQMFPSTPKFEQIIQEEFAQSLLYNRSRTRHDKITWEQESWVSEAVRIFKYHRTCIIMKSKKNIVWN